MTNDPVTTIRLGDRADGAAIAALHTQAIAEGFLVTLGAAFLRRLYARVARSKIAFVFVAVRDGRVCGFAAVAEDTRRLYREFLLRDGIAAGSAALAAIAREPRRVWETFRYGVGADRRAGAEILSIAVADDERGRGLGEALVAAVLRELAARDIRSVHVVTAGGNVSALRTYEKAGLRRVGVEELHAGVTQQVLVWP